MKSVTLLMALVLCSGCAVGVVTSKQAAFGFAAGDAAMGWGHPPQTAQEVLLEQGEGVAFDEECATPPGPYIRGGTVTQTFMEPIGQAMKAAVGFFVPAGLQSLGGQ